MIRFEILLPLFSNDGRPIEREKFVQTDDELDLEGPTAAVYNHGWVIGDPSTISVSVQAEMDSLLEVVPQK